MHPSSLPFERSDSQLPDPQAAGRALVPAPGAPFGSYRLGPLREAIRRFGAGLVPRGYPRLGSIINWPIWRLSLIGRAGPVDLMPYEGFALRLYPRQNHADAKCYARPALCDLSEETAMARCAAQTPDERFIMVDVGANTGTYSVLGAALARRAGRTPHLLCIEANPKTQARLIENLHFSQLAQFARVEGCAVSDTPGEVILATAQWNLGSVKVVLGRSRHRNGHLKVPARTLTSIIAQAGLPRVDLLKIDIEGHEIPALAPFLCQAPPALLPAMILAETKHQRGAELTNLLLQSGYRISHKGRSDTVFER